MSALQEPLDITGLGLQSALGSDPEKVADAIAAHTIAARRPPEGMEPERCPLATRPMDLDRVALLGEKGVQYLNRASVMAIAAIRDAVAQSGIVTTPESAARMGIVLGTAMGSFRSISEFTREALTADPPYAVSPMMFPSIVLNAATAQAAIWLHLQGLNTTVSEGHLSGIMAMRYAAMAIRRGYTDAIAVGAVEELCPQTAWLRFRAIDPVGEGYHFGEGVACMMLERAGSPLTPGRTPLGRWLHSTVSTVGGKPRSAALADCITRCLREVEVAPEKITIIARQGVVEAGSNAAEDAALTQSVPTWARLEHVDVSQSLGDLYGAAGAAQLVMALVRLRRTGGLALVTSSSSDSVGCALLST